MFLVSGLSKIVFILNALTKGYYKKERINSSLVSANVHPFYIRGSNFWAETEFLECFRISA